MSSVVFLFSLAPMKVMGRWIDQSPYNSHQNGPVTFASSANIILLIFLVLFSHNLNLNGFHFKPYCLIFFKVLK